MSAEILTAPEINPHEAVLTRSDKEIGQEIDGILAATTASEARRQQLSFEEISMLFLDAHSAKVQQLQEQKRELVLDMLLDNPAEAFRAEFLQLKLLYEARTLSDSRYDGTEIEEFCTQNHERGTCDYLFRHTIRPQGGEKYEVSRVFHTFGQPTTIAMVWQDERLQVVAQKYERGRISYVELAGDKRERVLAELFYDTIKASALQFEREPDEQQENDRRAMGYLKKVRDDEYMLF